MPCPDDRATADGAGPAPAAGPALAPGQRLGEWVLEAPLGAGAFGAVWAARHNALPDRRAAVKVPHDPARARALREEGALQTRLTDPHVVGVLGLDPDHDPPYLAVELVEPGSSLRARLAAGPLPPREALALARDVARGLAAAHAAGVVHRDLKPENVLVDAGGRARVADFGLGLAAEREAAAREAALLESASLRSDDAPGGRAGAEALGGADDPTAAGAGSSAGAAGARRLVGTPRYMAPEQRAGGDVGPPADVYALGLVLFELLAGVPPGGGEVPSDVAPGLDPALDALFRALCARDPARRPTAADAAGALDDLLRGAPARPGAQARAPRAASLLWRASALGLDALPVALLTLGPLRGPRLLLAPVLLVAYDAVCALVLGRSLGKRLLGLALVTPGGRPLDPLAAFARAVLRGLSLAPLGLGYAPALLGLGPALHDHLAQSRVVHEPPAA